MTSKLYFRSSIITILIFSLVFGLSNLSDKAYAQPSDSGSEQNQKELEEKIREAREELDKRQEEKEKQEEKKDKIRQELEEEQKESDNIDGSQSSKKEFEQKRKQAKKIEKEKIQNQKQLDEKRKELIEKAKKKSQELSLQTLENNQDIRERISKQTDDILEKIISKVLESAKFSLDYQLDQKAENIVKEKLGYKLKEFSINAAKEQAYESGIKESSPDQSPQENTPELSQDKIKEKLMQEAQYKSELISEMIHDIGISEYQELKEQYKEKIKEKANLSFQEIKSKLESRGIPDQIKDGSYFGIEDIPEGDLIGYSLKLEGKATMVSDPEITRPVIGNIVMELIFLEDETAMLKIIGGDFEVFDSNSNEIKNVWDVSVGRARVLFEKELVQISINAVNLSGDHASLRIQAQTEGSFPLEVGDVMTIQGDKKRTTIGKNWTFEFDGTITVDDIIPIDEFEDVEATAQASLLSHEIAEESIEENWDEIHDVIEEVLEDEFDELRPNQLRQIQDNIQNEIIMQLEEKIVEEIEDKIAETIEDILAETAKKVETNSEKIKICHVSNFGTFDTLTLSIKELNAHLAHGDIVGECSDQDNFEENDESKNSNGIRFEDGGNSSEANDEEP